MLNQTRGLQKVKKYGDSNRCFRRSKARSHLRRIPRVAVSAKLEIILYPPSLISGNIRDSLVSRIQAQLDQTIAREVAARERAIEEAKQQAGAFPTLYGTTPTAKPIAPQPQTHKVLSLNSKSKKVLLSSYTSTPASSRPASRSETEDEEAAIMRIPPPSTEVNFARGSIDPARPWANLVNENPEYVSPPTQGEPTSRRRRRKGKDRDNGSRAQDDNVTASRP
ncbi:hypothetical protein LENED_000006 [Lentinula edodes]|uniref:Uncharacterized protein n=1 Tax=Lentinula edodes TaxID=5353 RepID=A0A1Q3DUN8_LENED|nr:hypothetical protein LENED_000006 [Lentinula edodes]